MSEVIYFEFPDPGFNQSFICVTFKTSTEFYVVWHWFDVLLVIHSAFIFLNICGSICFHSTCSHLQTLDHCNSGSETQNGSSYSFFLHMLYWTSLRNLILWMMSVFNIHWVFFCWWFAYMQVFIRTNELSGNKMHTSTLNSLQASTTWHKMKEIEIRLTTLLIDCFTISFIRQPHICTAN